MQEKVRNKRESVSRPCMYVITQKKNGHGIERLEMRQGKLQVRQDPKLYN